MGYHFVNPSLAFDAKVDPTMPEILVYNKTRDGRYRLDAVEYFVADADQNITTDTDRPTLMGHRSKDRWKATKPTCRSTTTSTPGSIDTTPTANSAPGTRISAAPDPASTVTGRHCPRGVRSCRSSGTNGALTAAHPRTSRLHRDRDTENPRSQHDERTVPCSVATTLATVGPESRPIAFVCVTCGTQHAPTAHPPPVCRICTDDRQHVGWLGQEWTTHDRLAASLHNRIEMDGDLLGVGIVERFAIPSADCWHPPMPATCCGTASVSSRTMPYDN